MTPGVAAFRLLCSLILGALLGLWYGFLRPLGRHTLLRDLLFAAGSVYVWLYLGFALCDGDLRMGCFLGLFLGAVAWEWGPGRWLYPVFFGFWGIIGKVWKFFLVPAKNF